MTRWRFYPHARKAVSAMLDDGLNIQPSPYNAMSFTSSSLRLCTSKRA